MLDYSQIEKYDPSAMHKIYDRWPEIARNAYESNLESVDFDNIDHIVFAGMGGSGSIGDLFSAILSKTNIHVNVVKGYLLPRTVNKNTLVVTTSISGNTVETLTVLDSTKKLNCKVIGFSSGGKMESFCNNNGIEYRKIQMFHSPRTSFTSFAYSMLSVLDSVLPIQKIDVLKSIMKLEEQLPKISSSNLTDSNPSLRLAQFIDGIPCIYYPFGLHAAAIRFKSSLQENAKIHAFAEDIIEACHNGIVSWEKPSEVRPILIRGTEDYVKTKERWEVIKQYFDENGIAFREVLSVEGNILSKLITLIYQLDYSSIYASIITKVDPSPTYSINFIKQHLI